MKKIFALFALMMVTVMGAKAQDLTDNYQRIYAGYTTYNLDESKQGINDYTTQGFQVGYAYAFNITGHHAPLFLELGAEFNYGSKEKDGVTFSGSNVAIPLNITYKFGNENFSVAPFVGEGLRVWTSMKADNGTKTLNMFDENENPFGESFTRVQAVLNAGVNFTIKQHLLIGYRFQVSTTSVEPKVEVGGVTVLDQKSDMAHSITVGYVF